MEHPGTVPVRGTAQETGFGGGNVHTRAILKSAVRPVLSALLPDMPLRLAPPGPKAEDQANGSSDHHLDLAQVCLSVSVCLSLSLSLSLCVRVCVCAYVYMFVCVCV